MTSSPILVLGGTGKTGRRVAERLQTRGVPVRIGSRAATPPFDWDDRSTWARALQGTSAAYVSFYPDIALPSAPDAIAELAARPSTSVCGAWCCSPAEVRPRPSGPSASSGRSGADWTVVRCSWFNQNFSEAHFRDPLLDGELALPVDGMPEPFVDAEDVADVAAAALTSPV